MREKAYRIALGGIMSAAAVVIMFFGSLIPLATFIVPAIASLCIVALLEEGYRLAISAYTTIALLAVLVAPDKEIAALFAGFFGYYPLAKTAIEIHVKFKPLAMLFKLLVFNISILLTYTVITRIIVVNAVSDEMAGYTFPYMLLMLAAGNVTFLIFDAAISKFSFIYRVKLRGMLQKH